MSNDRCKGDLFPNKVIVDLNMFHPRMEDMIHIVNRRIEILLENKKEA